MKDTVYILGKAATKGSAGNIADGLKSDLIEDGMKMLEDVGTEVLKEIAGLAVGPLLRIVLKITSTVAKRLDRLESRLDSIEKSVDKISLHSFDLALRLIEESLVLPRDQRDQKLFRSIRLTQAINELERSKILLEKTEHDYSDALSFSAMMIQGMIAFEIPGSSGYPQQKLSECLNILNTEISDFENSITTLEGNIREEVNNLNQAINSIGPPKIKQVKIGQVITEMIQSDAHHKAEVNEKSEPYERNIKKMENEISLYKDRLEQTNTLKEWIKGVIERYRE
ncbi:MAG: hypothetical protein AAFX87_05570 [Bacteroidota bacterium]